MNTYVPEIIDEIYLDFDKVSLYGFQRYYDPLVIELMRISEEEAGIVLPKVDVVKLAENEYSIAYFRDEKLKEIGGGHHRSRRGLDKGFLRCNLRASHDDEYKTLDFCLIQEINPINYEQRQNMGWAFRFQDSLGYLIKNISRDRARRFCINHNLDPKEWGIEYLGKSLREIINIKK